MNCQTFQELLNLQLDGGAVEAADLEDHLRECRSCRRLIAAARRLEDGLRRLRPALPAPGFAAVVSARVLADRRARRRWLAVGLVAAASMLVALGWSLAPSLPPTPQAPNPLVQDLPTELAPKDAPDGLRDSVTQAGSAVAALTSRTASEAVDQARLLLPAVTPPMPDGFDLQEVLAAPAVSFDDAGQGLKAGLEPVTSSARRAVGLFLRDLPPIDPEAKRGL
jgi:hypothetical protein